MTSRLTREAFMPSVPMEMPSLTVMVPKRKGKPLARRTPLFDGLGDAVKMHIAGCGRHWQGLATAMNARSMSSSFIPTARSIDRAGARWGPSVTMRLLCFTVVFGCGHSFTPPDGRHARRSMAADFVAASLHHWRRGTPSMGRGPGTYGHERTAQDCRDLRTGPATGSNLNGPGLEISKGFQ